MSVDKVKIKIASLKSDSEILKKEPSKELHEIVFKKQNVVLMGREFNVVTSSEIAHSIGISHSDLMDILPLVANESDIRLEEMHAISSPDANSVDSYLIHLL